MKKITKYFTVFLVCIACSMPVQAASLAQVNSVSAANPPVTVTPTPVNTVKEGWYNFGSQKRYYVKNKYYTGTHKIGKYIYYFDNNNGYLKAIKKGNTFYYADGKHKISGLKSFKKNYYYFWKGRMKTGWVKIKGKAYYFASNGKRCTGIKKINGHYYFFSKYGALQKKRVLYNNKIFYCNSKGILEAIQKGKVFYKPNCKRISGVRYVNKNYHYYINGIQQVKDRKQGSITYHCNSKGVLEYRQNGNMFYYADGRRMSQEDETFQRAKLVVDQITNPGMTMEQKLETCFRWVMKHYYFTRRSFQCQTSWPALYADDYLSLQNARYESSYLWSNEYFYNMMSRGNCFSDGCAFAYLAKAIGYTDVNVCADARNSNAHCWAEINGLVYDPLFAEVHKPFGTYGAAYGNYRLYPVVRQKI